MQAPQAPEEQRPVVAAQTQSEPAQEAEKKGWQLSPEGDAAILHGDLSLAVASLLLSCIQFTLYESLQAAMQHLLSLCGTHGLHPQHPPAGAGLN